MDSRYPIATGLHLRVLAELLGRYPHRLSRVAWGLWVTGLPVTRAIRLQLIDDLKISLRIPYVARVTLRHWGEDGNRVEDRLLGRRSPLFSTIARHLHPRHRETIVRSLLAALASAPEFDPPEAAYLDLASAVKRSDPSFIRSRPHEVRAQVQSISNVHLPVDSFRELLVDIRRADDRVLEAWRDSSIGFWHLWKFRVQSLPLLMPREFFLSFLRLQKSNPAALQPLNDLRQDQELKSFWLPPLAHVVDRYDYFVETLRMSLRPSSPKRPKL